MQRPGEERRLHRRILKCTLEIEHSRSYWRYSGGQPGTPVRQIFEQSWFGSRSLERTEELVTSLRARYDAFPEALAVLSAWPAMKTETRILICHWHLQLSDPLYRTFSGDYLAGRHELLPPQVSQPAVVRWIEEECPGRWATSTRIQLASKLLSAAFAAGLVGSRKDPRPLKVPRVSDEALTYLLYLLRPLGVAGGLLANPYLASVGLRGSALDDRLRLLTALAYRRQGQVQDFGWCYDNLTTWAEATLFEAPLLAATEASR